MLSSYFHNTKVGHHIKSRASRTVIDGNRIVDGTNGTASYNIDVPNGGTVLINDNDIVQGAASQNPALVHFGGERRPTRIQSAGNEQHHAELSLFGDRGVERNQHPGDGLGQPALCPACCALRPGHHVQQPRAEPTGVGVHNIALEVIRPAPQSNRRDASICSGPRRRH